MEELRLKILWMVWDLGCLLNRYVVVVASFVLLLVDFVITTCDLNGSCNFCTDSFVFWLMKLGELKLGELLDTPPPGLDEAIAISKVIYLILL